MLQKVSIQNFKSLKDVTLELQKVNLLIGPNNSGKSNFLKALELLANYVQGKEIAFDYLMNSHYKKHLNRRDLISLTSSVLLSQENIVHHLEICPIPSEKKISYAAFIGHLQDEQRDFQLHFPDRESMDERYSTFELVVKDYPFKKFANLNTKSATSFHLQKLLGHQISENPIIPEFGNFFNSALMGDFFMDVYVDSMSYIFDDLKIYGINPSAFIKSSSLGVDIFINETTSNLVSFLDNIKEENPSIFNKIEQDLNKCIPEFTHITLPKTKAENGYIEKKIKLLDKDENGYWADELSEGTLYFLALLCIVHQPNPPKLLLLEEPEKGIHPRRIKEVLDFIFQLAEDKDIQVIMTTHSERVLDEFEDIPEAVFIFDKDEEGATQVKNLLKDVIEPSDKLMEENGVPRIKFTDSLGSHWVTGFIGGVPR
jgi:predicted ATP-dependent endonuclease of OLD family